MSIVGVNNIEAGKVGLKSFTKWLNPDIDQNTNKSTFKDAFIGGVFGALAYPVLGIGGLVLGVLGGLFSKSNDRIEANISKTNKQKEVTEVVLKGVDEHARDSACSCVAHLDEKTGLMHIAKGKRADQSLLSWLSLGAFGSEKKSLTEISEDDARQILKKGKQGENIAGYTGSQVEAAKRLNQVAHLPEVRELIETWTKNLSEKNESEYQKVKNYFKKNNENIYNLIIVKIEKANKKEKSDKTETDTSKATKNENNKDEGSVNVKVAKTESQPETKVSPEAVKGPTKQIKTRGLTRGPSQKIDNLNIGFGAPTSETVTDKRAITEKQIKIIQKEKLEISISQKISLEPVMNSPRTWSFISDKATLDHLDRIEELKIFVMRKQSGENIAYKDLDRGIREFYVGVLSSKFGLSANIDTLSAKELMRLLQGLEKEKLTSLSFALSRYRDQLRGRNQVVQGVSNRHKVYKAIQEVYKPYGIPLEKFNAYDGDQRDLSQKIASHCFDTIDKIDKVYSEELKKLDSKPVKEKALEMVAS